MVQSGDDTSGKQKDRPKVWSLSSLIQLKRRH